MATQPAQFGFTNTTIPAILTGGSGEGYLFWDELHPTTVAHKQMAQDALFAIVKDFSPRRGVKTPMAAANGLNGLVK